MDVEAEPYCHLSTEQMTEWYSIGRDAIDLAEKLAAPAYDVRQAVSGIYTSQPIGVYLHKNGEDLSCLVTLADDGNTLQDYALVESALLKTVGKSAAAIGLDSAYDGDWIKVAYTPALHNIGEALGFFPHVGEGGQLSGSPGPIRSMLTSGLVGAGLGYGGGYLAEQMLPNNWKKGRLRNTLATIGGAAGMTPGALWGATNKSIGKPFNDNSLLYHAPNETPDLFKGASDLDPAWQAAVIHAAARFGPGELIKEADGLMDLWDIAQRPGQTPFDVDIDAMNHTLWETGASPQLAGSTMGALAAAQQMPGGREDDSGWVTPMQMAQLAAHMGAGYASGAIVGGVLGLLTGLPDSAQDKLKQTGAYLGAVKLVIPKLFER